MGRRESVCSRKNLEVIDLAILPSQVEDVLESAWMKRDEIVPCFIGSPGIGKTQGVYDYAEKKGAKVVEIIASQILPNEVSGITMPVAESHSMEIYDHARLASLEDGDILFFDELLQAPPQTLAACLTLIQERRMLSGRKLPDIMIVAAANPLSSPSRIPLSIRQRFMFVDVVFNAYQWQGYMKDKYHIDIPDSLAARLESDSDQYNCLTPRTLTKIIAWRLSVDKDDLGWSLAVNAMFDDDLVKKINQFIEQQDDKRRIIQAIEDSGLVPEYDIKDLEGFSMSKMLEAISCLPEADEIMAYLDSISYKEDECTD